MQVSVDCWKNDSKVYRLIKQCFSWIWSPGLSDPSLRKQTDFPPVALRRRRYFSAAQSNRRKIRLFSQAKVTQTEIITRTKKKLSDSRGLSQRAQLCKTRFKLDAMFKSHALQCPPTTSQVTQSNRRGKKGIVSTESWCGYVKHTWRFIELTFRALALRQSKRRKKRILC